MQRFLVALRKVWRSFHGITLWLATIIAGTQAFVVLYYTQGRSLTNLLNGIGENDLVKAAIGVQTIVIGLLVAFPISLPRMHHDAQFDRAITASHQFLKFWYFGWISWLGLYFLWFLDHLNIFGHGEAMAIGLLLDFLNLLASCFFFLCYLVMVRPTVPDDTEPQHIQWYREVSQVFIGCISLIVVEGVVSYYQPDAGGYFRGLEGLLAGIEIALLVGRFDAKFIDTPSPVVAALYAYAIIQFSYPELGSPVKFLVLTSFALVLKVVFFILVQNIVRSGTLTVYMIEYRKLYHRAEEDKSDLIGKLLY